MFAVTENESFAYEPDSGYADPYSVTTAFAQRAREMGARVKSGVTVTGIETEGGKITGVETSEGRYEAPIVVVAAGPWSGPLLKKIGVDVPISPMRTVSGGFCRSNSGLRKPN